MCRMCGALLIHSGRVSSNPALLTDQSRAALDRGARLNLQRDLAIRRHAKRLAARFAPLILGDLIVLIAARQVVRWVALDDSPNWPWLRSLTAAGPFADPGRPGSLVFVTAIFAALLMIGGYSRHRQLHSGPRIGGASLVAAAVAAVPLAAVVGIREAVSQAALAGAAAWMAIVIGRVASEAFLRHVWPRERGAAPAILVGAADALDSQIAAAIGAPGGNYRIVELVRTDVRTGTPSDLISDIRAAIVSKQAEAIVLAENLTPGQLEQLFSASVETGCRILCPVRAIRLEGVHSKLVWHHDQPFFEIGTPVLHTEAVMLKRVADIVGSVLIITLSLPLFVGIAIAIKLDSRGPVLFAQDRAGLGGRRFRMLKFRTMRDGADSEKEGIAHLNRTGDRRLFKIPGDPRVTRLGRFLRRRSLDELPQLWNVLKGDMSLVGPRPFFESDFSAYEDRHFRRLDAKPGITGLWQVSGRSDVVDFEDVVFLDRQYIEQWSFGMDVSILFRTIPAVFRRTGAY